MPSFGIPDTELRRILAIVVIGIGLLVAAAVALRPGGPLVDMRPIADPWDPPGAAATARDATERPPCTRRDPQRLAFFGDLHVHTAFSMDARSRDMLATPDAAYRFARGEAIGLGPFDAGGRGARRAQLERPLDFAAVTDHAEWIGEVWLCTEPGSASYDSPPCRAYRGETEPESLIPGLTLPGRMSALIGFGGRRDDICGSGATRCREALRSAWVATQRATERWNDTTAACRFSTFHGWEHSYSVNLSKVHRNVIFANASVPELPISSLEVPEASDLWDRLDRVCTEAGTGCEVLTIPHNPNASNGRLFEITWADEPLEERRRQARQRARLERLVEMMQVKGESECASGLWGVLGEDELCGFEKIRAASGAPLEACEGEIGSGAMRGAGCQSRVDFARYALVEGLRQEAELGVNPFQFGWIGSTDTHNATPGDVEEHSYAGCCANHDATSATRLALRPEFAGAGMVARNPGGLMGVWAEENSRASLFEAMRRRETFATSGPRIRPRFFAAWEGLEPELCDAGEAAVVGYERGVPMGGVLPTAPSPGARPTFFASALRDPGSEGRPGGRLDRLQVIKVWYDDEGRFHQAVHDVAGRVADGEERLPEVDLATCEPEDRGADALCAVWTDTDFDPGRRAAYYLRVVETPSCRWSWWECLSLGEAERPEACRDPAVPRTIQERAWSSPIWIDPVTQG